jgi:hypothetical protein
LRLVHVITWSSKIHRKSKNFVNHCCKLIFFSHKKTPSKKLKPKVVKPVPNPEPQVAQQIRQNPPDSIPKITRPIPSAPKSQVIQQNPAIPSAPIPQDIQQNPATFTTRRQIPSARRPIPARSSLVQAFQQILAQQNNAEYINVSSGDEDEEY